jgi:hypothetical protein
MKMFTITELMADAGKIVAQVADGEPAMIVGGSKTVVLQPIEPVDEQGRTGYYRGTDGERQKRRAIRLPVETKRDGAMIRAAMQAVRKERDTR